MINNDTIKIITNCKISQRNNRHTKRERNLIPHIQSSATACVQSGNQKSTPLGAAGIGESRY
jgi:hypothetical protein